jgi:NAD-dependent dihydropyrimidine dehydrogenase PreA subunit
MVMGEIEALLLAFLLIMVIAGWFSAAKDLHQNSNNSVQSYFPTYLRENKTLECVQCIEVCPSITTIRFKLTFVFENKEEHPSTSHFPPLPITSMDPRVKQQKGMLNIC